MPDIEPCPFCEDEYAFPWWEPRDGPARFAWVQCGECGAMGPKKETADSTNSGLSGAIEAAIAAWNALSRRLRAADQMSQGCRATEMHIERQADLYDSWKDCAISISDLVSELAKAYEKSRSE